MRFVLIALIVWVPMLVEAVRASRNERTQLMRGGVEPRDDVYRLMRVVYPAMFAVMLAEGVGRGPAPPALAVAGLLIFAAAKAIKWSAIFALGAAWTFRVIVVPGAPLVTGGPYRYVRHPNYVGVGGEILGVALMTRALVSGPLVAVVFGLLLLRRLAVEQRALAAGGGAQRFSS